MRGNFRFIARQAGLTPGFVARALQGRRGMSLSTAARIAKAAHVSIDDLYAHVTSLQVPIPGRPTRRNPSAKRFVNRLLTRGYQVTPMD